MAKRNALFKRASELLKKDGLSTDDAIQVAYQALVESRRSNGRKKKGNPGGQPGTPPVMIVENNCLGELPDCSGESNNPFRRIDGTCNNLGGSRSKRELRRSGGGRRGGGNITRLRMNASCYCLFDRLYYHSKLNILSSTRFMVIKYQFCMPDTIHSKEKLQNP